MVLPLVILAGLLIVWLLRLQQPRDSRTGLYFWLLGPCVGLFTWMMLVGWSDNTPGAQLGIAGFIAFMWILLLAFACAERFRWAPRVVTGTVALAYLAYVIDQAIRVGHGEPIPSGRGAASLPNAIMGLVFIGMPAALFTFWRPGSLPALDELPDDGFDEADEDLDEDDDATT